MIRISMQNSNSTTIYKVVTNSMPLHVPRALNTRSSVKKVALKVCHKEGKEGRKICGRGGTPEFRSWQTARDGIIQETRYVRLQRSQRVLGLEIRSKNK